MIERGKGKKKSVLSFLLLAAMVFGVFASGVSAAANANVSEFVSDTGVMIHLGSYWTGEMDTGGGVAEIVAFNPDNLKMYLVSGNIQALDIVSLADLRAGGLNEFTLYRRIDIGELGATHGFNPGDMTSVAVNTRLQVIVLAVQHEDYDQNGSIVFLDYSGNYIVHFESGNQPDMIGVSPDNNFVMTANEGEPRMGFGEGATDPEGSITIIDLTNVTTHDELADLDPALVITAGFHAFDSDEVRAQLIEDNVMLMKSALPSVDLEPEYIAFSCDSLTAFVVLQEANAIAAFDIETMTFTSILGLGFKDHGRPGNEIDFNEDGEINIQPEPGVFGVFQPDGIAVVTIDGVQYILTPNEGDSRSDWPDYDNVRRETVNDAPRVERLLNETCEVASLRPDDIFILGGRSFSIFRADDMSLVFDSGSDFETITARISPEFFNTNHAAAVMEGRSARKGPEPEKVAAMQIGDRFFAFIALERIGGVMMYDITDPENAFYVDYLNVRDFENIFIIGNDLGAEGIVAVSAEDSPIGYPLVLVANEVSGTITVIQVNLP